MVRRRYARLAVEHAIPLFGFAILSILLTWPTAQHLTSSITGTGTDARHYLWQLWYVKEAILLREPLFYTYLLYYPVGISMLSHGGGPVMGLFALPFWPLGPEAAYNGSLLVDIWLTGYSMYLLARGLGFDRGIALFAGVFLMSAEMPLAGLHGHKSKTFLGFLPLTLLTWHYALDIGRRPRWTLATAAMLLLTLLYAGWQFVLAALSLGAFALLKWLSTDHEERMLLTRRILLFAAGAAVIVGPLLLAIVRVADNPAIAVDRSMQSIQNQPDLLEFFLPNRYSRLFGARTRAFLLRRDLFWSIETTVSLSLTGVVLSGLALLHRSTSARRWLAFTGICMLLALGPSLKLFGNRFFTAYELPIILPYAFLTELPGMSFMRAPGRFMFVGFVGVGIVASFGLDWLVRRFPRGYLYIVAVAIIVILAERWPMPWPHSPLRPVPQFYRDLARDPSQYGVFDLPIKPTPSSWEVGYSAYYQMYQMTHRKGIAAGYISRAYTENPIFPCFYAPTPMQPDVRVNGTPVNCYENARYKLAHQGYRYVVWHAPKPWYPEYTPGSWGEIHSKEFIRVAFGNRSPIVEDELVTVYDVPVDPDVGEAVTNLELGNGWYIREEERRWAVSPATLTVLSPRSQPASLRITPASMYDPKVAGGGRSGVLDVQHAGTVTSVAITMDEPTNVPLALQPGMQTITLTLQSGNFRPREYGSTDPRTLSFSIRSIDLRTTQDLAP